MENKLFQLTEDHIKLARALRVTWSASKHGELGAPSFSSFSPYGATPYGIRDRVCEILGYPLLSSDGDNAFERYGEDLAERAGSVHLEMTEALQIILSAGTFEPGVYREVAPWKWEKLPT